MKYTILAAQVTKDKTIILYMDESGLHTTCTIDGDWKYYFCEAKDAREEKKII